MADKKLNCVASGADDPVEKKLKLPRLMALLTYKSISSYDDALLWGHHVRNH